jgi:hypothetical protein
MDQRQAGALASPRAVSQSAIAEQETGKSPGVDAAGNVPQHGFAMPETNYARERRSSRVFMRVRVVVAGKNNFRRRFREACETIVINAHGGLLYLNQELEMGALVVITNPFTQEEQESRVVYLGDDTGKGLRVGLEFLTPAPHFWSVDFAQPDWMPPPARPTVTQQN